MRNPRATESRSIDGEKSGFGFSSFAAIVACALACLGAGAATAAAAPTAAPGYGYDGTSSSFSPLLERHHDLIAVDGQGRVFTIEGGTFDGVESHPVGVDVFPPNTTTGSLPLTKLEFFASDIAIDRTDDALYVQEYFGSIHRYVSDGKTVPTYTLDPSFEVPYGEGIAVDQTTGDLLVADPGVAGIRRYDPAGTLVETIPTPGITPFGIATAPDGSVYVVEEGRPDILHFTGTGTLIDEIPGVGEIKDLTVDPVSGRVVVALGSRLKTYSPSGTFLSETVSPKADEIGIAVDGTTGRLYGTTGTSINAYVPATWPGAEGPTVSAIAPHSVHLSGEVDPGAGPPSGSEAHFEYSADGGQTWTSTPIQGLGGPATVEADVTGLLANFTYQVRLVAENALTSHVTGSVSFSTPAIAPEVTAGSATDIGETSAVLNAAINPAGIQTTYHFDYGITTAYGSRIPAGIEGVAGNGRADRIFSRTIEDLAPGTTYHFRVVAQSSIGVTYGPDREFTTVSPGGVPVRGYEQVTPVDKHGTPLDANIGFQVSENESDLAYINRNGVVASPQYAYAISRRGTENWTSGIDLSVPLASTSAFPNQIIGGTTLAISPDFTHQFVATNTKLTPGAIEGGTNLYRVDIDTRTPELIGSFPSPFGLIGFIAVQQFNKYTAGNADFSWIIFKSEVPLLPGAPGGALYRWSVGNGLEVISVLPDGEEASTVALNPNTAPLRFVSADGSRVYFQTVSGSEIGLFLREEGKPTKAVSVSHRPGDPTAPVRAGMLGGSKDGRYFYFLAYETALTPDAPENLPGSEQGGVYRYDAVDESLEYLGAQAEAQFQPANASVPAIGVSEDGSTAYFRGQFTSHTYVWRNGVLSTAAPSTIHTEASPEISPDGRYLVYRENSNVYLYDAVSGTRTCASCLPDGSLGNATLPAEEKFVSGQMPRSVTDAGEVFFTSAARLVAADVNGSSDVYSFKDGKPHLISPGNGPYDAKFADVSSDGRDVYFTTNQKLVGQDNDDAPDIYDARIGGGLAAQSPPPPAECLRDDCKATPNAGPELPFGGSEALSGQGNVVPKPSARHCGKGHKQKGARGKRRCVKHHKPRKHTRRGTHR